jgi:hypothetical protein
MQAASPLSDHQQALVAVMATAAANRMTQASAAQMHQNMKTLVHPPGAQAAGAD